MMTDRLRARAETASTAWFLPGHLQSARQGQGRGLQIKSVASIVFLYWPLCDIRLMRTTCVDNGVDWTRLPSQAVFTVPQHVCGCRRTADVTGTVIFSKDIT